MFFSTKDTIAQGVGFSTFGITHLIWLVLITIVCVGAIFIYRRADSCKRNIMRIVLGITIVLLEVIKDIVAIIIGAFNAEHLPFHLCGINILLIGFDIFRQTRTVRSFLYYFCIPGALLALLFPNWTVLPCMNFFHIHSFVIHALLVLYPLLLVSDGEIKTGIKEMLKGIALLVCMAIPIYFVNLLLDTNFMFLMDPETGNPLGLFEKYLGSHLWGFPILLPVVMLIMYIPLFAISKCKKKSVEVLFEAEKLQRGANLPQIGFMAVTSQLKAIRAENMLDSKVDYNSCPKCHSKNLIRITEKELEEQKEKENSSTSTQISSADELKKFKDLLDNGVITQEEFEEKKKQLLGL